MRFEISLIWKEDSFFKKASAAFEEKFQTLLKTLRSSSLNFVVGSISSCVEVHILAIQIFPETKPRYIYVKSSIFYLETAFKLPAF